MSKTADTLLVTVSGMMRGHWMLTPATAALIAGNLIVFGAMLAHGAALWHSPNGVQLAWGANFGPATRDGQWWRLGTAMFVHFGLVHLTVNMWALWDCGRLVERLYGHWRFLVIYGAGGMAGNLFSLLAHGDVAVSGGASGAIFSAYGALLVCLWLERRQIHPIDFRWLFGGAALFAAATIAMGLMIPGIDNAAHLGGLVSGALAGYALSRPLSTQSPPSGGVGRWWAATSFLIVVVTLVVVLPAPKYRWAEELKARTEIGEFLMEDRRIEERWRTIIETRDARGASFEELAARIESEVTNEYRDSFEQLSALTVGPAAPSANALGRVKRYAQLRAEASHALAVGLSQGDPKHIQEALEVLDSLRPATFGPPSKR